jgi:putative nucleotidyltransferase with HDIG domain
MYVWHEVRDRMRRWLRQGRLKNTRLRRALLGSLFFAVITLILATQVIPQRLDVSVGLVAPVDLQAPYDKIPNRVATLKKRQTAADAIPMLPKTDPSVLREAEGFVTYAFDQIASVRGLPNQDAKLKAETLTNALKLGNAVPPETYSLLLTSNEQALATAKLDALALARTALAGRVEKQDVADLRVKIDQEIGVTLSTTDPALKTFVKEIVKKNIRANRIDDVDTTEALRKAAYANEEPVFWQKGQTILKKGEPVTEEQYETLKDLHLVGSNADLRSWLGMALLAAILVALTYFYLKRYQPDLLEQEHKLFMLGLIGVVTLVLALIMRAFRDSLGPSVAYLMPVAVNGMLITILLNPNVALFQNTLLLLILGMSTEGNQLHYALVALVGSAVGVYAVARVESRTDVYRAGLFVAMANVVTILTVYLMQAASLLALQPWIDAGLGALNGLLVAVLVTGALPFFENVFGVVTPLKLIELSNPNHPLLKKLMVEAPGSYHHTILVANLCEAAAEAVGADQVLARVGAYYHDIGKVKRPYFFVENQFGGENPHDKLPPSLSALIITSHVKDGVEMAKEARLPQEIIDFIPEHHGTTLVSYFYHMANKTGHSEYILEEDFRYDGPKPRSRETGILMLADGCEASVRAMRQKGQISIDQIEAQVKQIVEDRLRQGQLENCNMTFRDLDVIIKTFVKVLSGVHHARIEYPPEALQAKLTAPSITGTETSEEAKPDGDLDRRGTDEDPGDSGAGVDGSEPN